MYDSAAIINDASEMLAECDKNTLKWVHPYREQFDEWMEEEGKQVVHPKDIYDLAQFWCRWTRHGTDYMYAYRDWMMECAS